MASPVTKRIDRYVELRFGVKNSGQATKLYDYLRTAAQNAINANARLATDTNGLYRALDAAARNVSRTYIESLQKEQKAGELFLGSIKKIGGELSKLGSIASQAIRSLSSFVGGEAIGFGAGWKTLFKYNQLLLSTSSQWTKYGKGIRDVEAANQRLAKATGLTQQETFALMSQYEKGFPRASFEGGVKLLTSLRGITGGNAEAMKGYLQTLEGVVAKYPELERSLTRLNSADKQRLDATSRLLFLTGRQSMAEHKRLQDILFGNKQIDKADQERKQAAFAQIDAQNKIRQVLEKIALQVGTFIDKYLIKLADRIEEAYEKLSPFLPTIIKVAAGITVGVEGLKIFASASIAIYSIWKLMAGTWTLMSKMLPGMTGGIRSAAVWAKNIGGSALSFTRTGGGVGASQFGSIAGGTARMGLGAVSGYMAGSAVNYGYEQLTGKELNEDYGKDAYVGSVSRVGARGAAGFATGGVPGAIAGIGQGIIADGIAIKRTVFDILQINKDIASANQKIAKSWDTIASQFGDQKQAAAVKGDTREVGRLTKEEQAARKMQESEELAASSRENWFLELSPKAKKAGREKSVALRQEADALRSSAIADREKEKQDNIQTSLQKAKISLNPSQLNELIVALEQASGGNSEFLKQFGISEGQSKSAGTSYYDRTKGADLDAVISQIAKNMDESGKAKANVSPMAGGTSTTGLPSISNPDYSEDAKTAQAALLSGDLATYAKASAALQDKTLKSKIGNVMSFDDGSRAAANAAGISDALLNKQQIGVSGDDTEMLSKGMAALGERRDKLQSSVSAKGDNATEAEKKELESVQKAHDTINAQLEKRDELLKKPLQLQQEMIAEANELRASITAQNELLGMQENRLATIVDVMATTGRVDMGKVTEGTDAALKSLDAYVEGQQRLYDLDVANMKLLEAGMDAQKVENTKNAAAARAAGDTAGAEKLERENAKIDIQKEKGSVNLAIQASMVENLTSQDAIHKRIIETVSKQLEVNRANTEASSAQVSKVEALVSLYDNLGMGLSASAEMRMNIADKIGKQIEQENVNLSLIDKAIVDGADAIAAELMKNDPTMKLPDAQKQAQEEMISLQNKRVQKETEILQLQGKQAQTLKTLRDGYVSAISAMNAGSGMFAKVMIDQNKNLGVGLKYMGMVSSMRSGGSQNDRSVGGRDKVEFSASGGISGQTAAGSSAMWDTYNGGGKTALNAVELQKKLQAELKRASSGSGAAASVGENPYYPGAAIQSGQTGPKAEKDDEKINHLSGIEQGMWELVDVVSGGKGLSQPRGALNGAIVTGDYSNGDQTLMKVAGGEMILTPNQYGELASAMNISANELRDIVAKKDFARLLQISAKKDLENNSSNANVYNTMFGTSGDLRQDNGSKRRWYSPDSTLIGDTMSTSFASENTKPQSPAAGMTIESATALWSLGDTPASVSATQVQGYQTGKNTANRMFGSVMPRFANGGIVPNMGDQQSNLKRMLGVETQVGDTVVGMLKPGEKVSKNGSDETSVAKMKNGTVLEIHNHITVRMDELKQLPGMIETAVNKTVKDSLGDGVTTSSQSSRDYL